MNTTQKKVTKQDLTAHYSNVCIRCGKARIKSREWTETVTNFWGTSEVIYEETVCPDPECQKIVDEKLKAESDKKKFYDEEREKRAELNKQKRKTMQRAKK